MVVIDSPDLLYELVVDVLADTPREKAIGLVHFYTGGSIEDAEEIVDRIRFRGPDTWDWFCQRFRDIRAAKEMSNADPT
jgi:hypothetical protein